LLAQQFFTDHHGIQESFYEHDLIRLRAVTLPQHMQGCELVENFRKNKYVIHLCSESYQNLKSHLQVVTIVITAHVITFSVSHIN